MVGNSACALQYRTECGLSDYSKSALRGTPAEICLHDSDMFNLRKGNAGLTLDFACLTFSLLASYETALGTCLFMV